MSKTLLLFIIVFFSLYTSAQTGIHTPWVWMKGSNYMYSPGSYGTIKIENPSNEPISRVGGSTFIDREGNLWLFGGMSWQPAPMFWYFNDLWKYNPVTNNWTWMKGSNLTDASGNYGVAGIPASTNNPGAREQAASWTDEDGNFWIFGGEGFDKSGNYGIMNDLWKFDVSFNNWIWINGSEFENHPGVYGTQGMPDVSNRPPARASSATWADSSGNLWLFGGYNHKYEQLNDLWRYSISNNEWTWMKGPNGPGGIPPVYGTKGISSPLNTPAGRFGNSTWIGSNDQFYLFGGNGIGGRYSDLWKYTVANNEWTWISGPNTANQPAVRGSQGFPDAANRPGAIGYASSFKDLSGNFWLFRFNDLWRYSPVTNQWAWMKGGEANAWGVYGVRGVPSVANKPGGRFNAMSWSGPSGNFWLFGGYGYDVAGKYGELNDLWTINSLVMLPSKYFSLTGKIQQREALLQWQAVDLSTISDFIVERSFDGIHFDPVGNVRPVVQQQLYHFSDPLTVNDNQKVFYRLKIMDFNNSYTYSEVILLRIYNPLLTIYPNPANTRISFTISSEETGKATYDILDQSGRTIKRGSTAQVTSGDKVSLDVSALPPGSYLLRVASPNGLRRGIFVKM